MWERSLPAKLLAASRASSRARSVPTRTGCLPDRDHITHVEAVFFLDRLAGDVRACMGILPAHAEAFQLAGRDVVGQGDIAFPFLGTRIGRGTNLVAMDVGGGAHQTIHTQLGEVIFVLCQPAALTRVLEFV